MPLLLLWLLILISGAPSNTLAERRLESVAHGFKPAFGYTEPKRGTECWGEGLLVTFVWAGFRTLQK
ncbi:hypothetical protein BFW86_04725 [Pseudomonas fluorescens]|nr:hypothetical protein BFW86_04725 [Pseudomonas fluorescens]